MKRSLLGLPDHVARLLVVFVVFIGGAIAVRTFVIPASLKETGRHRTSTEERESAKEPKYAGASQCGTCHDAESAAKAGGYHRNVSCETCHGAAKIHADDPSTGTPPAPRTRGFCPVCHAYDPSRPTGFPQINPAIHNPLKPCIACHNPHDPKPPVIPTECTACHGEIARTKAVSPHALLPCTTCHDVPEQHRVSPRTVTATKPNTKAFCVKCHGKNSTVVEAPKIDADTHGEKYLCWDCHYPHLPEARSWTDEKL